jgi:hypothetical protein
LSRRHVGHDTRPANGIVNLNIVCSDFIGYFILTDEGPLNSRHAVQNVVVETIHIAIARCEDRPFEGIIGSGAVDTGEYGIDSASLSGIMMSSGNSRAPSLSFNLPKWHRRALKEIQIQLELS